MVGRLRFNKGCFTLVKLGCTDYEE